MFLPRWMFKFYLFFLSVAFTTGSYAGDWIEHKNKVTSIDTQITSAEKEIRKLLRKKSKEKNVGSIKKIIDSLVVEHRRLKKEIEKRNREIHHMRFRHPEKGGEFDKRYFKGHKLKSIEEFEQEIGLSGQLSKIRRVIDKHFNIKREEDEIQKDLERRKKMNNNGKRIRLVK